MSDCVGCLSAQNPDVLDDGQRAILNINKESTCPHTDNGGANSTNGTTPALCDSACAATCNATCAPLYPQLVELCVDEFNVFNDTEACSTALCGVSGFVFQFGLDKSTFADRVPEPARANGCMRHLPAPSG